MRRRRISQSILLYPALGYHVDQQQALWLTLKRGRDSQTLAQRRRFKTPIAAISGSSRYRPVRILPRPHRRRSRGFFLLTSRRADRFTNASSLFLMASTSSLRSSPESNAKLQRGQACFNCRRRKRVRRYFFEFNIVQPALQKCDGFLPCGQCTRLNAEDECAYTDPDKRPAADILQEHIDQLKHRIYDLEQPRRSRSLSHHRSSASASPVLGSSSGEGPSRRRAYFTYRRQFVIGD